MSELDKLAQKIKLECEADGEPITDSEATEMASMELKAKGSRHYEQSNKPRKKAEQKPRQIDEKKLNILNMIERALVDNLNVRTTKENETKIHLDYDNASYTVSLTRHRNKK